MRERPPDAPVQRIGVAYVDSPEAREALRVAAELAQETGATLTLYTVVAPRAEVVAPVIGRDAEISFLVACARARRPRWTRPWPRCPTA